MELFRKKGRMKGRAKGEIDYYFKIVSMLCVYGSKIFQSEMNPTDRRNNTPLHWAAVKGQLEVCKFIIANVDNKNPSNNYGRTPLHGAANSGHVKVCQLLMENVEDKNPSNSRGNTSLHDAAQRYLQPHLESH